MKTKFLSFIIYTLGFFCGIIFIIVNVKPLGSVARSLIIPRNYGDLYYQHYIDKYKTVLDRKIPFSVSELNTPLKKAGIILYGDSFSNLRYFKGIPELLIDSMKVDLHFAHTRRIFQGPVFPYLAKSDYQKDSIPKFLIFQSAERVIDLRLRDNPAKLVQAGTPNPIKTFLKSILARDAKRKYTFLLKDTKLTRPFYSFLMNKRYDWFGYVDSPKVYDEKTGMFFNDKSTSNTKAGFYYQFSDEEIELYCNHLEIFKNELKSLYNLDFVFFPVPNKISIYSHILNNDEYNNLLPRLYECMEAKSVDFVDIYNPIKAQKELMYFKTDTHWNEKGAQLSHNLLMKKIREIQARTNSKN